MDEYQQRWEQERALEEEWEREFGPHPPGVHLMHPMPVLPDFHFDAWMQATPLPKGMNEIVHWKIQNEEKDQDDG